MSYIFNTVKKLNSEEMKETLEKIFEENVKQQTTIMEKF